MDKKGAAEPCQATEWFCAAVTRDDDILMAVFCFFFFFPACFSLQTRAGFVEVTFT